jgi:serine/threonine protein kinase
MGSGFSGNHTTAAGETHRPGTAVGRETPTIVVASDAPTAAAPTVEPASPYRILREIGHGGMSVVYLAKDLKLGRFVAIKQLSQDFLGDGPMRERFFREAQLIASLNHIYIVKLYDFDAKRPEPRIVMEYVAGPGKSPAPDWPPPSQNLEQKLDQNGGPLTLRTSVVLVRKLCSAIDYAHRNGVIHRDLKPSNVLLDEHGEPRIVDFGIARQASGDAAKLTMTGTRMLSLGYAAPEQEADPANADARSDIYSLGGILYFCLTGENPRFFRDSRIPDYLRPMLLKAMEQDPRQRWATARDFAEVLTQSAGDFLSPLTDPGMWRCKWCNALNPVANRYCSHCNWDGMERCPECDGETRVGVRFCAQCSTDIKSFEDMRALLSRLREYRRQKDFPRIKDAMDAVERFRPRGTRGQELAREIRELGDTADWAIQRKDELTQAIAAGLERQDYEGVHERLNEYGVLDDGPEYQSLRSELPWRIAERDIHALRTEVQGARQLIGRRKPGEARTLLAEIENRLLAISRLEIQFPVLKGALTVAEAGAEPGEHAKALAAVSKDVEQLKADLDALRKTCEDLLQQASLTLRAQDYEGCLKACERLREITGEPSEADAMARKAAAQNEQMSKILAKAGEALEEGHLRIAERMGRDVIDRLKGDSIAARHLLARVKVRRRRRAALTLLAALLCGGIFYALSIGPVYYATLRRDTTTLATRENLDSFYEPVYWLHRNSPLRNVLEWYANRWNRAIFQDR